MCNYVTNHKLNLDLLIEAGYQDEIIDITKVYGSAEIDSKFNILHLSQDSSPVIVQAV
jgi:hypothetical protein